MKKEVWIVVANSSRAKIFKAVNNDQLKEIEALDHPESRLHDRDLTTTPPGRAFDSIGTGRHAMEPKTTPKTQEFAAFAKHISHRLDAGRESGAFTSLYVIASPNFLGLLRQTFSDHTNKLIAGEVGKDMIQHTNEEIRQHLPLVL